MSGTSGGDVFIGAGQRKGLEELRKAIDNVYADNPTPKVNIQPETQFRSMGGTIGGIGSPTVDSVPAMLAPGEEVIRTASANMFRPVLKDINDNAGRLYTDFEKGTFLQERQIRLSELNNKSFGESAEKFDEMVEKLLRKQQQRKQQAITDTINRGGNILQVLNRTLAGVNVQQTGRQHNDPSYPIGQVVGGNELEPMINNETIEKMIAMK